MKLLVVLALGLGPLSSVPSSCHRSECGVRGAGGLELELELELLSHTETLSGEEEGGTLGLTLMHGGVSKVAGVSSLVPCLGLPAGTATAAGGTWAGSRAGQSESRRCRTGRPW